MEEGAGDNIALKWTERIMRANMRAKCTSKVAANMPPKGHRRSAKPMPESDSGEMDGGGFFICNW